LGCPAARRRRTPGERARRRCKCGQRKPRLAADPAGCPSRPRCGLRVSHAKRAVEPGAAVDPACAAAHRLRLYGYHARHGAGQRRADRGYRGDQVGRGVTQHRLHRPPASVPAVTARKERSMVAKGKSGQKFIARNRAPRVQIEYDVEIYGSEKKIQLPFLMGVMADLSGKPADALPDVADRKFLDIDIDNFDARLKAMKPRVAFQVPNTLTGQGNL